MIIISSTVTCSRHDIAKNCLFGKNHCSHNYSIWTFYISFFKQDNILYSNALIFLKGLPSIQVPHENYTVNYGESITVECKVVSNPEHTSINWTKLVNGNYISINFLGGKYGGSIVDMPSLTVLLYWGKRRWILRLYGNECHWNRTEPTDSVSCQWKYDVLFK